MNDIKEMLKHYDEILNGDAWHGEPLWKILDGISAWQAAARPISAAHTIWEIVAHMTFWEGVVTKRLRGERAGLVDELNFPATPAATEENWQKTMDEFRSSNAAFRSTLEQLEATKLQRKTAAGKRTYWEEAQGIIEHHLYHVGQIALLKKTA